MSDSRRVSVVVNNFNYARFVRDAVDSALAQTHPRTEVVVVDDGSTDESWDVIRGYGGRVTAVRKENGGQASAFNAGFAHSRGDVIIFLDADDVLLPTAAAEAARALTPGAAKVHWPLRVIDADSRPTGELLPREPLPEGDLHDAVVRNGPDSYLSSPTSGNAWSRHFLAEALPAPEAEYRQGADGYLLNLAPLFGQVRRLAAPQGCYRIHGKNQFWCDALDERTERSLQRYEQRCSTLAEFLRRSGTAADPAAWKRRNPYYGWLTRLRAATAALKSVIPPGAVFVLVDGNEWGGQPLTGRGAVPFLERNGAYWGPPADDATAVRECERLRASGATFLAVGWPAFWWLEHYPAFHDHLHRRFRRPLVTEDVMAFDLRA